MSEASLRQLAEKALKSVNTARTAELRTILQGIDRYNFILLDNYDFIKDTINALLTKRNTNTNQFSLTRRELSNALDKEQSTIKYVKGLKGWLIEDIIISDDKKTKVKELLETNHLKIEKEINNKDKEILGQLYSRDPGIKEKVDNKTAFLARNFQQANSLKYIILDIVLEGVFTNTAKSEEVRKLIYSRVEKGHGAGLGASIAYTSVAEIIAEATDGIHFGEEDRKGLENYILNYLSVTNVEVSEAAESDIKNITLTWKKVISPNGTVLENYFPYVTFQDYYSNKGADSLREKRVLQAVRAWAVGIKAKDLAYLEGSPPLIDKMIYVAINPLAEVSNTRYKNVRVRVKIDRKYRIRKSQLSSKGSVSTKDNKKVKKGRSTTPAKKPPPLRIAGPTKSRPMAQQGFNQLQLVGILNASLPPVVRKNMQFPALQNRTGLFSESVKVVSIDQTPKGFPSISYTYDKIPYQVFEMGVGKGPWATPERDPRKLIEKSVRELAADYMTQRFYTKRV
jgi:hypothetical protein